MSDNSSEHRKEYKKQWRIQELLGIESKFDIESKERPQNMAMVSGDGYLLALGDGKTWTQVYNPKLRAAIKEIFNFADWLLPLNENNNYLEQSK